MKNNQSKERAAWGCPFPPDHKKKGVGVIY